MSDTFPLLLKANLTSHLFIGNLASLGLLRSVLLSRTYSPPSPLYFVKRGDHMIKIQI